MRRINSILTAATVSKNITSTKSNRHEINYEFFSSCFITSLENPIQRSLGEVISNYPRPGIGTRHVHFINFTGVGDFDNPTYINTVRDPIER